MTVLTDQIRDYITHWNTNPKPFAWTATADNILAKVRIVQTTKNSSTTTPSKTTGSRNTSRNDRDVSCSYPDVAADRLGVGVGGELLRQEVTSSQDTTVSAAQVSLPPRPLAKSDPKPPLSVSRPGPPMSVSLSLWPLTPIGTAVLFLILSLPDPPNAWMRTTPEQRTADVPTCVHPAPALTGPVEDETVMVPPEPSNWKTSRAVVPLVAIPFPPWMATILALMGPAAWTGTAMAAVMATPAAVRSNALTPRRVRNCDIAGNPRLVVGADLAPWSGLRYPLLGCACWRLLLWTFCVLVVLSSAAVMPNI